MMFSIVSFFVVFAQHVVAQSSEGFYSLSGALNAQPQLTNFTALLSSLPTLFSQVSAANHTILAPSDEAFADYLARNSSSLNSTAILNAVLSYHIIPGLHTLVEFETGVQFLPTLLTDTKFSNVTGGQRVGVFPTSQGIVLESGIKSRSQITIPNIPYKSASYAGVIHAIDKVLELPTDEVTTIIKAELHGVIAVSLPLPLSPNIIGAFGSTPDWTVFIANRTILDLSMLPNDVIINIEDYHAAFGHVYYSPDLKDGLQIQTVFGPNLTVTVAPNGTKYLNDAEIIYSDYLMNTGVFHVLEHELSPNKTDARPALNTETHSATITPSASPLILSAPSHSSLSKGAKVGIGVGAGVGALLLIGMLYFCCCRSKSKTSQNGTPQGREKDQYALEMPHPDRQYSHEMEAPGTRSRWELGGHESQRASLPRVFEMQ